MIAVAAVALQISDHRAATMKSYLVIYVNGDFLVACEAKTILARLVESFVTLRAVALKFGVTVDQFPRHNEGFDNRCPRCHSSKHYETSDHNSYA